MSESREIGSSEIGKTPAIHSGQKEDPKVDPEVLKTQKKTETVSQGVFQSTLSPQQSQMIAQQEYYMALRQVKVNKVERLLSLSYLTGIPLEQLQKIDFVQLSKNSPILLTIDTAASATGHIAATLNLASTLMQLGYDGEFHIASSVFKDSEEQKTANTKLRKELALRPELQGRISKADPEYNYSCVISGAMDNEVGIPRMKCTKDAIMIQMQPIGFKEGNSATLIVGQDEERTVEFVKLEDAHVKNLNAVHAKEEPAHEIVFYNLKAFIGSSDKQDIIDFMQCLDRSLPPVKGGYTIRSYGSEGYKIEEEEVDLKSLGLKNITSFTDVGKVAPTEFAKAIAGSELVLCEGANTANLCSQIGTPYIHVNKGKYTGYYPGQEKVGEGCIRIGVDLKKGKPTDLRQVMGMRKGFIENAKKQSQKEDTFLSFLARGLELQKQLQEEQ